MGIRQLQTFIQYSVPDGYIDVSLNDECESFNRNNNERPIFVIDLMGLLKPQLKCKKEMLCGVRHNEIYKNLENLFKNLSAIGDLIFFEDGPVNNVKFPEWIRRQNDQYETSMRIIDKVYNNVPLEIIVNSENNLPTATSPLKICKHLAKKYGKLIITINKECDTEMAQFACRNKRVLAILADDSDFLIYPGKWRYFSLRELNEETLTTKEYNRNALRSYLELNDQELVLLSTLNGNDVISFDETYRFHKSLIQQRNDPSKRFPAIAEFIKTSQFFQNRNVYSAVAYAIFRNNSAQHSEKVQKSFEMYDVNFEIPEIQDRFLRFCRENSLNFIFSILSYIPKKFTIIYLDLRQSVNYYERTVYTFRKIIGIILRFERDIKPFQICTKMSFNDVYRVIYVDPIIPTVKFQPSLFELLDRSKYPQHDIIRFQLLKWVIKEENFEHVKLELIPKNIFADILVLVYMVNEGYLDPTEADILMLSIKHVNTSTVPENLQPPDVLHPRAFFITFIFSKCHKMFGRCLEATGLKDFGKLPNFDGVLFQNLYIKHATQPLNLEFLLGDISNYRYYAL